MPVETRYFRSDSQTVNGLTARKLGVAQSGTAGYVSSARFLGIRVWKRHADGSEEEITGGTAVAIADTDEADGLYSGTWNCPETSLEPTDAIVVRVYAGDSSPPTLLVGTWVTEQLGAGRLLASTWTVYYYSDYTYKGIHTPDCEYSGVESWLFRFDTATFNSRIVGFAWSAVPLVELVDVGVSVDRFGKLVDKSFADAGFGVDYMCKDVSASMEDAGVSVDLICRLLEKCFGDGWVGVDWRIIDLVKGLHDVFKGVDWIPYGVPYSVEVLDVLGVLDLVYIGLGVPPHFALEFLDRLKSGDFVVRGVGVPPEWLADLCDWFRVYDRLPWEICHVKEFVVALGQVLRDYPLTDWELTRNKRIVKFLGEHGRFNVEEFQRFVWKEQFDRQLETGSVWAYMYRSSYINNFTVHLLRKLSEKGFVKFSTKWKGRIEELGFPRLRDVWVEVVDVPSIEVVNNVSRRRLVDVWAFG